jgi:hypothetical protein
MLVDRQPYVTLAGGSSLSSLRSVAVRRLPVPPRISLFVPSWLGHTLGGHAEYNQQQLEHGGQPISCGDSSPARRVGADTPSTSCDLGIFVDQPAEAIQPHDRYVGR